MELGAVEIEAEDTLRARRETGGSGNGIEPTEDFRLDFEDGYGNRDDAEEDGHAASSAAEVAAGLAAGGRLL